MENLNLADTPPPGGPPGGASQLYSGPAELHPLLQNQQLPPQMFTTAAQLLDMTDSKAFEFPGSGLEEGWFEAEVYHADGGENG